VALSLDDTGLQKENNENDRRNKKKVMLSMVFLIMQSPFDYKY
jgi:hypothetical protein